MKQARAVGTETVGTAEGERRKRLGQYLTGLGLGRVLAALALADEAKSIIDPMAGSGDLLASCLEVGAKPELMAAIEIDELVWERCVHRLPEARCLLGNAFDSKLLSRLGAKSWDLVIANPPYVRYQSMSRMADALHPLPSAMQVRAGLLDTLPLMSALDADDKRLFRRLVVGYSGLSDLAVPSWIFCAGLVKPGGRLAMVVPESWLSRDYATIVKYMLCRWFDIEFVVEDEHASWFADAQVKTTLIVAKRVKRRASALSIPESSNHCHIMVSAAAATADSPIGKLALTEGAPEQCFAKQARVWLRNGSRQVTELASVRPVSANLSGKNIIAAASRQRWFAAFGEEGSPAAEGVYVPQEIHDWLSRHRLAPDLQSLEAQGVAIGQGLRTGANGFFYADGKAQGDDVALVFSGPLKGLTANVPRTIARPVLRRQSELPRGFAVSLSILNGWALDLGGHALPEDIEPADAMSAPPKPMPDELVKLVRAAARANFGSDNKPQKIWQLSAVWPNIRPPGRKSPARHWYMLPCFSPRHRPDILLARISSATPKAYLNEGRACLVDANFSTMWTLPESRWTPAGILAFMNSTWVRGILEKSGSVMGGGALKVEATHLRRIPVPSLDEVKLRQLDELGKRLVILAESATEIIASIDATLAQTLGCSVAAIGELNDIALVGQSRRAKHNGRRG